LTASIDEGAPDEPGLYILSSIISLQSLGDLTINLLAALIGYSIARLVSLLRFLRQTASARRFWRPFAGDTLRIFIPVWDAEFEDWERSGLAGVGSVKALLALEEQLREIRFPRHEVCYSSDLRGSDRTGNLVLIGGPDANALTAEVLERLNVTIENVPGSVSFRDRKNGAVYSPREILGDDRQMIDYGSIIRAANPHAPKHSVLILNGSFGAGTYAAARFACHLEGKSQPVIDSSEGFEILFRVEVLQKEPQAPDVLVARQLGKPQM